MIVLVMVLQSVNMRQNLHHYLPATIRGIARFNHVIAGFIDNTYFSLFERQKLSSIPVVLREHIKKLGTADTMHNWAASHVVNRNASTTGVVKRFFERHSAYFSPSNDNQTYLERRFVEAILWPAFGNKLIDWVTPQYQQGRYRIDFVVEGNIKWAIETDGFEKFKNSHALEQ